MDLIIGSSLTLLKGKQLACTGKQVSTFPQTQIFYEYNFQPSTRERVLVVIAAFPLI